MMTKYCRSYLLITAVFLAVSFFNDDNLFFLFYPCVLCGMIPINLLSYDERSGWLRYSGTLPYKRAQIVGSKYLIGLFIALATLILTGAAHAVKMNLAGTFTWQEYLITMLLICVVSCLVCPINMPLMFKYGTEKGRILYLVMIGVVCCISALLPSLIQGIGDIQIPTVRIALPLILLAAVGIYALSWYLSVQFFKKREI